MQKRVRTGDAGPVEVPRIDRGARPKVADPPSVARPLERVPAPAEPCDESAVAGPRDALPPATGRRERPRTVDDTDEVVALPAGARPRRAVAPERAPQRGAVLLLVLFFTAIIVGLSWAIASLA